MAKPGELHTLAILTLVSGVLNLVSGIGGTFALLITGVVTFGLGCCFLPLPILLGVCGALELRYALELLPDPIRAKEPNRTVAVLEIVCILAGNVVSVVVGILALVWYDTPQVKAYFASRATMGSPPPAEPPVPPVV